MRVDIDGHIIWQPRSIYFLFVCGIVTTHASPTRYTTGYLQGRSQTFSQRCHVLILLLCPCRCYGVWFHSNSSCSEWTMLLRKRFHSNCSWSEWDILLSKLETLTVCASGTYYWASLRRWRCVRVGHITEQGWDADGVCEWDILLSKLETLTVCMWCFRIRCGGKVCSSVSRLLENRLQSVIRCLAVCTALSG
jgi:hypothetical protein